MSSQNGMVDPPPNPSLILFTLGDDFHGHLNVAISLFCIPTITWELYLLLIPRHDEDSSSKGKHHSHLHNKPIPCNTFHNPSPPFSFDLQTKSKSNPTPHHHPPPPPRGRTQKNIYILSFYAK